MEHTHTKIKFDDLISHTYMADNLSSLFPSFQSLYLVHTFYYLLLYPYVGFCSVIEASDSRCPYSACFLLCSSTQIRVSGS